MISPSSGELQGFAKRYISGEYNNILKAKHDLDVPWDLENLSEQIVNVVAGFISLRPKENEKEREIFIEVFNKLKILESSIKKYCRQREAFLSVVQQFDLSKIATYIAMATMQNTIVLNYSQSQ